MAKTPYEELMAMGANEPAPKPSIAQQYQAYQSGNMPAAIRSQFEADVAAGKIMLPKGAVIAQPKSSAVMLPTEITRKYLRGELSDTARSQLEEDVRDGIVKLAPINQEIPEDGVTPLTEQPLLLQEPKLSFGQKLAQYGRGFVGAAEADAALLSGATTGFLGYLRGDVEGVTKSILSGTYGTPEAANETERLANERAQQWTYSPRTEAGQQYLQNYGQALQEAAPILNSIPALGGELQLLVQTAKAAVPAAIARTEIAAQPVIQAAKQAPQVVKQIPGQVMQGAQKLRTAVVGEAPIVQEAQTLTPKAVPRAVAKSPEVIAKPSATGVSEAGAMQRNAVMEAVGLPEGQRRLGAATGNIKQIEQEVMLSKLDGGTEMKAQIDLEAQKLGDYMQNIVNDTKGTPGAAPIERGAAISKPLEKYQAWYDDQIRQVYTAADEAAQAQGGIKLSDLKSALDEPANFKGDGVTVARDMVNELKRLGVMDAEGNMQPINAKTAERIRQAANGLYDPMKPQTQRAVAIVKGAVDEDVMRTLPADVYAQARGLSRQYHEVFTDPKGMAKILDIGGPGGINRAVSLDKLPDTLANLAAGDSAQFAHIVRTLDSLPTPELRAMGQQAIAETRAHILERIFKNNVDGDIGVGGSVRWKGTDDSLKKALAPYRGKLDTIFGPEIADKLETLQAAGRVLRSYDPNVSGTATALQNLAGIANKKAYTTAGAVVGGMVGSAGGPGGAAGGAVAGAAAAKKLISVKEQRAIDRAIAASLKQAKKAPKKEI